VFTRRTFLALVPLTAALLAGCEPPGAGGPVKVSKADYDRVLVGMSYTEVCVTLGGWNGEELSRNQFGNVLTVMYAWKNPDGSNMNATFQDDRLVSKGQFGLPPSKPQSSQPRPQPAGDKEPPR
jgi:hypothetical protein